MLGWLVPLAYSLSIGSIEFDTATGATAGARAQVLQEGTPVYHWLIGTCYVISTVLLVRRRIAFWRLPMLTILPLGLVLLAGVSGLWSEAPAITLRRSIALAGTTVLAFHLGWTCTWSRLSRLLGVALGLAGATSILASLLFPDWAVHHGANHDGDWRGLFLQKNSAGAAMVLALLVAAANLATAWPQRRNWGLFLAALALLGVVGSGSRTAWFLSLLVVTLAVWVALLRFRQLAAHIVVLISSLALLSAVVVVVDIFASTAKPEDVRILGRDLTATGRYTLWTAMWPYIADQPLAGYGFKGFWTGTGPCLELWNTLGWQAANGHSSWVDVLLELGALGLAMVLGLVLAFVSLLLRCWRRLGPGQAMWILGVLALVIIQGLSDTTLIEPNGPLWTLTLAAFFHLLRQQAAPSPATVA